MMPFANVRKNGLSREPRPCRHCGQLWTPKDRYQAARNKACSWDCAKALIRGPRLDCRKPLETSCTVCGKMFHRAPSHKKRVNQSTCSKHCSGILRARHLIKFSGNMKGRKRKDPRLGPENPAWKGGVTYFRKHGNYKPIKYVRCPIAFLAMARKDGYVMEHRLILAQWIQRPLLRIEVVHHENHDPQQNQRSNLELWPDNRSHKLAEHGRLVIGAVNQLFHPASAPL